MAGVDYTQPSWQTAAGNFGNMYAQGFEHADERHLKHAEELRAEQEQQQRALQAARQYADQQEYQKAIAGIDPKDPQAQQKAALAQLKFLSSGAGAGGATTGAAAMRALAPPKPPPAPPTPGMMPGPGGTQIPYMNENGKITFPPAAWSKPATPAPVAPTQIQEIPVLKADGTPEEGVYGVATPKGFQVRDRKTGKAGSVDPFVSARLKIIEGQIATTTKALDAAIDINDEKSAARLEKQLAGYEAKLDKLQGAAPNKRPIIESGEGDELPEGVKVTKIPTATPATAAPAMTPPQAPATAMPGLSAAGVSEEKYHAELNKLRPNQQQAGIDALAAAVADKLAVQGRQIGESRFYHSPSHELIKTQKSNPQAIQKQLDNLTKAEQAELYGIALKAALATEPRN